MSGTEPTVLPPGGSRVGFHTHVSSDTVNSCCEYTEKNCGTVVQSSTCMLYHASIAMDHPRAAHGPTGTPHGPPGLTFTPSRYCTAEHVFTAVSRRCQISAPGAPAPHAGATSTVTRTPRMLAKHARAPAQPPPAHARSDAPTYTQTAGQTRVRYSRKGLEWAEFEAYGRRHTF